MFGSKIVIIFTLLNISICYARVPLRNHETEETPSTAVLDNKPKEDTPVENPVERTPIDSSTDQTDKSSSPRKPVVILFRQNPSFSLFSNRQNPFSPSFRPTLFDHSHFNNFHRSSIHDDPAIKLISMLFGDRLRPPVQPESTAESVNSSSESSEESSRDVNPFESLFPNLFPIPRFPIDETDKEPSSSNEDKTPANFENKEKKVVKIGDRKFVKTTQVKKVKNDFGQFHSVISSYQPFDEAIHDENGNEKIKPEESSDDKVSSIDKKDVESSTNSNDKVDSSSSTPSEEKIDVVPSSSTTSSTLAENEKEVESTESPVIKLVTPTENKKPERLLSENLSKEQDVSKNEIPDKSVEIKVDQMN